MAINIDFLRNDKEYSSYIKYIECELESLPAITGAKAEEIIQSEEFTIEQVFKYQEGIHKYGVYIHSEDNLYLLNFGQR